MRVSSVLRSVVCLLIVGVCAHVFVPTAEAWPPPPRFHQFMVVNNTNVDIYDIRVELKLSDPNNRAQLFNAGNKPFGFTVWRLPPGRKAFIGTGTSPTLTDGIDGAAQICLKAGVNAPGGLQLASDVEINADRSDFDPANPGQEYSGFCSTAPPQQTDYMMTLQFVREGGVIRAKLRAKCRWGTFWSAQPKQNMGNIN